VLVLAVVALEVPLASSVADRIDAEVRSQARGQADVVAASVADLLGPGDARERERLVDAAAASVRGRVIVVDARGDLLADSEGRRPAAPTPAAPRSPPRSKEAPTSASAARRRSARRCWSRRCRYLAAVEPPARCASRRASKRSIAPCAAPGSGSR
jgi:hypothetical protein